MKIEKRPHKVDDITHVHFEEIYLYTARELGWVKEFMDKHDDHISFTAAGDGGQLEPVNQVLAVNSDEWYQKAMKQMFPRRLTLHISKRCSGEDRERMRALCDELRKELKSVVEIVRAAGLREVNFEDLTEEDARYPHIAAKHSTLAKVDNWVHATIGETFQDEYEIGQTLLGVGSFRCKGGRICSNMAYEVASIDDVETRVKFDDGTVGMVPEKQVTLKNPYGDLLTLSLENVHRYLKRPYAMTGHASQGLSLGSRIYVHDWQSHMANHRWVRTVFSRCGTLDIVLVNGSEGIQTNYIDINKRLAGHRAADAAKEFKWVAKDYITAEWIKTRLHKQRYCCYNCRDPLDLDWSVDRLDNTLPHLKDNCMMSCRRCNHASAHRPTFKPSLKPIAVPTIAE